MNNDNKIIFNCINIRSRTANGIKLLVGISIKRVEQAVKHLLDTKQIEPLKTVTNQKYYQAVK